MTDSVTYLGVKCKNCGSKIAIRPHAMDDRGLRFETITETVKVWCPKCGQSHDYNRSDGIHFDGPPLE